MPISENSNSGVTTPTADDVLSLVRGWTQKPRTAKKAVVTTIPFIIGSGQSTITTGVQAAVPIDFRGRITGIRIMNFDSLTGTIVLDIRRAAHADLILNPIPVWTTIINPVGMTAGTFPTISPAASYYDSDIALPNGLDWPILDIERGDYLQLLVTSVGSFRRLSVSLRLRRKEP